MIVATINVILNELPKDDRRYEIAQVRRGGIEKEIDSRISHSRDGLKKLLEK